MNAESEGRRRWWQAAPPPMQRTLADDVKVAAGILVGVALACLTLSADWSMFVASAVGLVVVTALLNVARRVRRPG